MVNAYSIIPKKAGWRFSVAADNGYPVWNNRKEIENIFFQKKHSKTHPIFVLAALTSKVRQKWLQAGFVANVHNLIPMDWNLFQPLLLFFSHSITLAIRHFRCAFSCCFNVSDNLYRRLFLQKTMNSCWRLFQRMMEYQRNSHKAFMFINAYVPERFLCPAAGS